MHGSRQRATLAWLLLFSRSITVSRDVSLVDLESYICAYIYIYACVCVYIYTYWLKIENVLHL